MEIKKYQPEDEIGWVRCRVLSFLDTAYFDNVLRAKEKYENPAIELIAVEEGVIVGLLDIEYEVQERTVCSNGEGLGGMIWHIAVHPDYQRKGIGNQLLMEAERVARENGLNRLEAWTRDDAWANHWYEKNGFSKEDSYFHVFIDGGVEIKETIKSSVADLIPIQAFAHYVGNDVGALREKFKRIHECRCYVKKLDSLDSIGK